MKPGERIRLIQESAKSLLTRPWPEAQLILDQFSFETYEPLAGWQWEDSDSLGYFIEQLKKGADSRLAEVHEYLLGDDARPLARVGIGPWTSGLPVNMFLSHVHEQKGYVGSVKQALADRFGIDGFVAHNDIHPSQQWREVIKEALSTCHAFAAFLHPGFHDSQWCDQEVGWALSRNVPIIVVRPEGVERRDGFLEEHQDLVLHTAHGEFWLAERLFEIVVKDPRTHSIGVRALAEAFVNSGSFDMTRRLYALLEGQEDIAAEQLRRLEYAVQTNRQVYDAVYPGRAGTENRDVPDLVAELVRRHTPSVDPSPYDDEEPF